ncbi:Odorant receptor 13a, partial [Anthophora retusa]
MEKSVTLEQAISFTKLSVALTCSWPPSPLATKTQVLFFNTLWCTAFVSTVTLLLPLFNGIYEYRKDPLILGKTVSLASAVAQVAIKMIMCRFQQKQFQILYFDLENFCKRANLKEKVVLQRYVDRYKYFHGIYILWCFLTTLFVISGPLYSPQTFPTHAIYPFKVNHVLLKTIIYFHQSLVGFQASAGMAIDTQVAFLLRYAAARFELLGNEMRNAKTDCEFNACIEKHIELLRLFLFYYVIHSVPLFGVMCVKRYTKKIRQSIKFLILTTIATTTVAVIFGSLNLIANQSLLLKALYAIVVFSASVELFMYAWPADSLMRMSTKLATDIYNTDWLGKDVKLQKKVYYIILRSQRLEAIRIDGVVPILSLPYYAMYLYKSMSYFTALRIIVESEITIETA